LEAIKVQFVCFLFHICRKFEFLISQGSLATCLGEMGSVPYGICRKFHTLSSSAKILTID